MNGVELLAFALVSLLGLLAALGLAVAVRRTVRVVGRRRRRRLEAIVRPQLIELLVGDGEAPLGLRGRRCGWRRGQGRVLESLALSMLPKLRGEVRERLVALLVDRGTAARARRRLRQPGAVGRAYAAEVLGRLGLPQTQPDLLERLGDRDAEVRLVAAFALARTPSPEAARRLLAALASPRPLPFRAVGSVLLSMGHAVSPVLLEALVSGPAVATAAAAEIAGLIGAQELAPVLVGLVGDSVGPLEVRLRAARALGRLGAPAALGALLAAVRDEEPVPLRAVAARALGDVGNPGALAPLAALLADPWHRVAGNAAGALTRLGPAGAATLREVAASATDPLTRAYAAEGLAHVRQPFAAPMGELVTAAGPPGK